MFQYGPKLPPPVLPPYIRQLPGTAISIPLSAYDVTDPNNPADPVNIGHVIFRNTNFGHSADFGPANPRNPNSPNYGVFVKQPMYNTYLV